MRVVARTITWTSIIGAAAAVVVGAVIAADTGESGLLAWILIGPIPFLVIAGYLYGRRPNEPVARHLVVLAVAALAIPAALEAVIKATPDASWVWFALTVHVILSTLGIAAAAVMIGLFPSGRAETRTERRFRAAVWAMPAVVAGLLTTTPVVPVSTFLFPDLSPIANPGFIPALEALSGLAYPATQLALVAFLVGLWLLIRRYRRTEAMRRRQIRWVLYSAAAAAVLSGIPFVLGELGITPAITKGVLALAGIVPMLMLPASIAIAVLEPPWIDTDAVIRRSAAYGILSIGVLALYSGLAVAFGVAAGQRLPVEVAILTTVGVAIVFHPARTRLQKAIDRWVYGSQPTRFDAVAGMERTIHDSSNVDDLAAGLADTARRALRLRWTEVTVPPHPPHTSGTVDGDRRLELVISHRDEQLGVLAAGPPARTLRDDDIALLETLTAQTGLALFNARLAARVVHAQEEERRRIERNIHDGAQQELVALVAKIGLARARAADGSLDEASLVDLQQETMSILRDLRALAQGIHPSVLTDGGIVEAVRDRASRLPISVTVDPSPCLTTERFTNDVEGAAYFFVSEALANILKHASATHVAIAMRHEGPSLTVTVSDDGVGFDPEQVRHNGLAGLADRINALSGSVTVQTTPGSGTELQAMIPVGQEHA